MARYATQCITQFEQQSSCKTRNNSQIFDSIALVQMFKGRSRDDRKGAILNNFKGFATIVCYRLFIFIRKSAGLLIIKSLFTMRLFSFLILVSCSQRTR